MKKTRLFHTLVLVGASLTGGAIATTTAVSVTMISGCDDSVDMGGYYFDIGMPTPRDLSIPHDLSPPDDLTSQD